MDFRLVSPDGTVLSATHEPARGGPSGLAFVVVPGFSGSWENPRVRQVCAELAGFGGVVAIDLRGHGRSAGATTLGKDEPLDASRHPISINYQGQEVQVCCRECKRDFQNDPQKFLKKIPAAE